MHTMVVSVEISVYSLTRSEKQLNYYPNSRFNRGCKTIDASIDRSVLLQDNNETKGGINIEEDWGSSVFRITIFYAQSNGKTYLLR